MESDQCESGRQGRRAGADEVLVVGSPAAPGYHLSLWPVDRFDRLRFRHVGTSYDLLRLYQARRAVNARKFHGWAAGVLALEQIAVRPTEHTRRKLPLYLIDTTVRIACLGGEADVACEPCPCGCGRTVRTTIANRLDFNTLPLGQPWPAARTEDGGPRKA